MDFPYSITLDAANTLPLVDAQERTLDLVLYVRFLEPAQTVNWEAGSYDAGANLVTNYPSVRWALTSQQATISQDGVVTFGQIGEEVTILATGTDFGAPPPATASMTLSIVKS